MEPTRAHRLQAAVTKVAHTHKVPYTEEAIRNSLEDLADFFFHDDESYVQLRIAAKASKKHLNYRAELFTQDAASKLHVLLQGLCESQKQHHHHAKESISPISTLQPLYLMENVLDQLDTSAVAVDCDPLLGLVKLWQFGNYTLDLLLQVDGLPESLRCNVENFCQKRHMSRVYCIGVDLQSCTMNVYFDLGENTIDGILDIFRDLEFEPPSDATTLDFLAGQGAFAMTLGWDQPKCERVCFYMASLCMNKAPKDLNQFMNDCALPHEDDEDVAIGQGAHDNSCFLSISFGRVLDQKYFKLESDWRNSYLELLSKVSHQSPTTQEDAYDLWQCTAPLASAITNIVSSPQIFTKYTASEVIPSFLYLGNATDASNLEWFQKTSITHVLNCADSTASGEGDVVHKLKLNYCQLDAVDDDEFNIIEASFLAASIFIKQAEAAPNGRIFVHCHAGVNRSATLVIAYLMKEQGLHVLDAVRQVWAARPIVLANDQFVRQLARLHIQLQGTSK